MKGNIRINVAFISESNESIQKDTIFCARKGERYDGLNFIPQAIEMGAVCVVVDDEYYFENYSENVPIVWVPSVQKFIAYAAATLLGHPSEALTIIAVTGTNGKTTTTHFIEQLLIGVNRQTLRVGTNGIFENGKLVKTHSKQMTTMQPIEFQKLLLEALHKGIEYVIIEASSQGLANFRLDYVDIDFGVFLNLTEDHIEWHGSIEKYKKAKMRLSDLSQKLIVNHDDTFCRAVGILSKKETIFFGGDQKATIFYEYLSKTIGSSYLLVQSSEEEAVIHFPFHESFLIENAMAAIAVCLQLNMTFHEIADIIDQMTLPIGRVQKFFHPIGATIIVDYAHTASALLALLQSVIVHPEGQLILVFSCGGNRDQAKRKKMGEVASDYADYIILTTDNCRNENPQNINKQIIDGFRGYQQYEIILERSDAINKALEYATANDTILIAGKGHENSQIIGNQELYFSDIEFVKKLIAEN